VYCYCPCQRERDAREVASCDMCGGDNNRMRGRQCRPVIWWMLTIKMYSFQLSSGFGIATTRTVPHGDVFVQHVLLPCCRRHSLSHLHHNNQFW
jgi:hypothetical protein